MFQFPTKQFINKYTKGKTVFKNKIFFGGGEPKLFLIPRFSFWGPYLSIWWLGTELVVRVKSDDTYRRNNKRNRNRSK